MSKELNIIEASNTKDTYFEVFYADGKKRNSNIYTDSSSRLIDSYDNACLFITEKLINSKFIPTQKSITFMEAITQNHYNDKTIRCEVDDKVYTYKPVQTKTTEIRAIETRGGISTEEILNGKWYIEEN